METLDRSKIGKMSHRKGNKFERDVCKKLGTFFFNDPKSFGRYHSEGNTYFPGDLGPFIESNIIGTLDLIKSFPFCFETKNREEWEFYSLLSSPTNSALFKYWQQTLEEAERFSKTPFLIFTKNYKPVYGMLDVTLCKETCVDMFAIPPTYLASIIRPTYKKTYTLTIFLLDDFITANKGMRSTKILKQQYEELVND